MEPKYDIQSFKDFIFMTDLIRILKTYAKKQFNDSEIFCKTQIGLIRMHQFKLVKLFGMLWS